MEWNVITYDINNREFEVYNVFRHAGVKQDIIRARKKFKDKGEFAEEVRRSLMYYLWSKTEWEILLAPWPYHENDKMKKVDVYWQIMNNWERFIDYVWEHRAALKE